MRKRLFALLLAAVLVLSMGTAQATAGEMSGTEQTELGEDVPVPAPDAADAAGDDAPAGEPGEDDGTGKNDALAGETGDPGKDDEFAGENGENSGTTDESGENGRDSETASKTGEDEGNDGETVPAVDNSMPSNDEPQTTADEPAVISVLFEGAEHITSLTANDADVLSEAKTGTPIILSADSDGRVSLDMELEDGYTAGADENSYDSVCFDGGMVEIRDDGDGKAVVQITERPQVIANSASGFTVIFEGAEQIDSVTNADNGTVYDLNEPVVFDTDSVALKINVKDGYYVQETDECEFERHYYPSTGESSVEAFLLRDEDGDGAVTVHILKLVQVTLVDEGKYVTQVRDSIRAYYDSLLTGSYKLKQDGRLYLEANPCELDVVGGHVSEKYYSVNDTTGKLSVSYDVVPDGAETMTVTTKPGDEAQMPKPIRIQYKGDADKIIEKDDYVLPGGVFSVKLEDGYMISVEGSVSLGMDVSGYTVTANMDATFITVTVQAVWKNAKLMATIPDAVENADIYGKSEELKRTYVGHGGTMADGKGWFLLKNGYEVGPGVEGGSVTGKLVAYNEKTRSIHTYYKVDAAAAEVKVPIVEAQPYRWVGVQVYDTAGCFWTIGSELVSGWDYTSVIYNADSEVFLPALDELTAELFVGYELEAVSGCTLRWEKDTDGEITYRIIPNEAGDTEVELRVIQAAHQQPVLKVGTDADADVQTDSEAESKLQDAISSAIDALAKGSVPAGMSQDTAEKLRAALKEADAVTVPELSAVLSVKREADTAAFPGAVAVYEIEIVLSVNGQEVGNLTELAQPISISLPLPPEAGRIVYLVRTHDGKQEKLAATVKNGFISFVTDQFSEFAIMSSNNLAEATVDPIPDQTWTGSALTPKVRVTIAGRTGEETLKEGTDYKLIYKDNVKAGTATVTIVGMGDFDGTSTTVTFRIKEAETEATTPPTDPGSTTGDPGSTTSSPDTGDEAPLTLYIWLLALSMGGLAAILLQRKKQQ